MNNYIMGENVINTSNNNLYDDMKKHINVIKLLKTNIYTEDNGDNSIFSKYTNRIKNYITKKKSIIEFVKKNNLLKKDSEEIIKNLGIKCAKDTYTKLKNNKRVKKSSLFDVNKIARTYYIEVNKQDYSLIDSKLLKAAIAAVMATLLIYFLQSYITTIIYYIFSSLSPDLFGVEEKLSTSLSFIIGIPISYIVAPFIQEYYAYKAEKDKYGKQFVVTMSIAETIRLVFTGVYGIVNSSYDAYKNAFRIAISSITLLLSRIFNYFIYKTGRMLSGFNTESYIIAVVINFLYNKLIPVLLYTHG